MDFQIQSGVVVYGALMCETPLTVETATARFSVVVETVAEYLSFCFTIVAEE